MEQIDWLLVGAGDVATKRVASALASAKKCRLLAVCDPVDSRARNLSARFHCEKVYADFSEALRTSGANAVYIATPVYLHVPQAIAALEAGKHVLVEKPLGLNNQQCELAVSKAKATGLVTACAYFRRCYPCFRYTQTELDNGKLGDIVHVRLTYHSWANLAGDNPKRWRVVKTESGGGPLSDMGSHMIDVLIGLLGMPRLLYGRGATLTHTYEVEDSATFLMELENGAGVTGSFHWNSRTWSHEFEIVGTEARMRWSPYDSGKLWKTVGRQTTEIDLPNPDNVHLPLVEDFVAAVLLGRTPVDPFQEAAKTNVVLSAIYESIETGNPIRL